MATNYNKLNEKNLTEQFIVNTFNNNNNKKKMRQVASNFKRTF